MTMNTGVPSVGRESSNTTALDQSVPQDSSPMGICGTQLSSQWGLGVFVLETIQARQITQR